MPKLLEAEPTRLSFEAEGEDALTGEVRWMSEPNERGAFVALIESDDGAPYVCVGDGKWVGGLSVSYDSLIDLYPKLRFYLFGIEDEDPDDDYEELEEG
jgi:hypothetical protein